MTEITNIFQTGSVVERLREQASCFVTIGDELVQADALGTGKLRPPAAFVITPNERANPNIAMAPDRHQQLVTGTLSIILANVPAATGSATKFALDALKRETIAALAGWTPPGAHNALQYSGANPLGIGLIGGKGLAYMDVRFSLEWKLSLHLAT